MQNIICLYLIEERRLLLISVREHKNLGGNNFGEIEIETQGNNKGNKLGLNCAKQA